MLFKRIHQVPAPEWKTWVEDNDAVIVDVREPMEWAQGALEGSKKIQLALLPSALDSLDTNRSILVVCRSGNRSQHAAKFLMAQGFENVANLTGGLRALGMAV
ncbi:MAG: rhodanese-like domain-containing protein [Acidimicrobiia bacterium]|nr:rhodanese-like domain-containing protein [Acidimicrobiia bacterium]